MSFSLVKITFCHLVQTSSSVMVTCNASRRTNSEQTNFSFPKFVKLLFQETLSDFAECAKKGTVLMLRCFIIFYAYSAHLKTAGTILCWACFPWLNFYRCTSTNESAGMLITCAFNLMFPHQNMKGESKNGWEYRHRKTTVDCCVQNR